jgi:hypothetical protein
MPEYIFNERDKAEFNRLRRKIDSLRGPNVKNTHETISIGPAAGMRRVVQSVDDAQGEFIYSEWVVVAQNRMGARMDRACPLIPNA